MATGRWERLLHCKSCGQEHPKPSTDTARNLKWEESKLKECVCGAKVYLHWKHTRCSSHAEKVSDTVPEQHRKRIKQNANCMYTWDIEGWRKMKMVIQNYGPWASQIPENLHFSPRVVPSDSLAVTSSLTGRQFRVTLVKALLPLQKNPKTQN